MQGWVSFHRKIEEWEWYDDANTFRLFFHLVLKANHKDNKWRGIDIKRGELVTSNEQLAKQLKLTVSKIRTSLNKLKNTKEITIKTTNKNTVVTVVNYDLYQSNDTEVATKIAKKSQSNDNQIATNNNEKNNNNENNDNINNLSEKKIPHVSKYNLDSDERRLTNLLINKITNNNEFAKVPDNEEKLDKWIIHIERLIRLDKADPQLIANVIDWCQKDSFWKDNILSTSKFRDKFAMLYSKYKGGKGQTGESFNDEFKKSMESGVLAEFLAEED